MGRLLAAGTITLLLIAALTLTDEAFAHGTLSVTLADYNSAQVKANGYIVSVPYGTSSCTPYCAVYAVTSGTKLEMNSRLNVTLPAGFTFNSQPTLTMTFMGSASPTSSAIGSQTATFTITADTVGEVYISAFALATPATFGNQYGAAPVSLSVQATNNASIFNDDASPVSQPAFVHAVGGFPNTIAAGGGHINLAFPSYGNQFIPGGNDGRTTQGAGSVGTFAVVTETNDPFNNNAQVLTAAGQPNTLAPTDTANITISGYFNGIGSAYATTTAAACQTTIPGGAFTGSVTNTTISFSGILINTPVQICIIPNGTMWDNNAPYVFDYSPAAGVTDFYGGLSQTTAGDFFLYSPSPSVVVLSGTPQHAPINTAFAAPFSVKVFDSTSNPVKLLDGINVIFNAPPFYLNGASGDFMGGGTVVSVGTDINGVATTPVFSANSKACSYPVRASVGTSVASFVLTNEPATGNDIVFCHGFEE